MELGNNNYYDQDIRKLKKFIMNSNPQLCPVDFEEIQFYMIYWNQRRKNLYIKQNFESDKETLGEFLQNLSLRIDVPYERFRVLILDDSKILKEFFADDMVSDVNRYCDEQSNNLFIFESPESDILIPDD